MKLQFHYNAPVILTFALLSTLVYLIHWGTGGQLDDIFSLSGKFSFKNAADYPGLIFYPLGHENAAHLMANLTLLLLLGPIVEEKYGAGRLLIMMLATTVITALLHILFFNNGLWGASGIVFMLIMLVSMVNVKSGQIPITFVLILFLFIWKEILAGFFDDDAVSQFAHIMGGVCGAIFGFSKMFGK